MTQTTPPNDPCALLDWLEEGDHEITDSPKTARTDCHLEVFGVNDELVVSILLTPEQGEAIKRAIPDYDGSGEWPITVYFGEHAFDE